MRLLTRNAVFAGSNGLWQTKALQQTQFDPEMQTEDIDVSVRMLLERHTIDFCPEARSGELAPVNLRALFKQRQRWAIGWDQVSLYHFRDIFKAKASCSRRAAVAWVLYSRWLMQVVGIIAGVASPILIFIQRQSVTLCHCGMGTRLLENCMFYFYLSLVISCTMEAIFQIRHRGVQSFIQVFFVGVFMFAGCAYILFQALLIIVSLFKIGTGRVGGWAITARGKSSSSANKMLAKADLEAGKDSEPSMKVETKAVDSQEQVGQDAPQQENTV
jgi:cellulose synthase/poly-beta-1,6-N-acetylglucosamine synthase-like glycosyltransferase